MSSELKNPFGIRNGKVVLIGELSQSEKGHACNCICPACSGAFIARIGDKNRRHFAHDGKPCSQTASTLSALYRLLKEFIDEAGCFYTPPQYAIYHLKLSPYTKVNTRSMEEIISFSSVIPERNNLFYEEVVPKHIFSVTSAKIIFDKQNIPYALILTEKKTKHQIAVTIVPPRTLCKTPRPKQYQTLSTIALYFDECYDWFSISASFLKEQLSSQNIHAKWVAGDALNQRQQDYIIRKVDEHNRSYEKFHQRNTKRSNISPAPLPIPKRSPLQDSTLIRSAPTLKNNHVQNFWPEKYHPGMSVPNEPLYDTNGHRWFICQYCKRAVNYAEVRSSTCHVNSAICWKCSS